MSRGKIERQKEEGGYDLFLRAKVQRRKTAATGRAEGRE